jgi:uncharacterized protein with HEPN domain
MKSDRELFLFVQEQIDTLEDYLGGRTIDDFLNDPILKDACLMKLLVIGEYANKISDSEKQRFSEIEWQLLKAARNFYAHAYGGINWMRVWETLSEDIPQLKKKIGNIIVTLENERDAKTN